MNYRQHTHNCLNSYFEVLSCAITCIAKYPSSLRSLVPVNTSYFRPLYLYNLDLHHRRSVRRRPGVLSLRRRLVLIQLLGCPREVCAHGGASPEP